MPDHIAALTLFLTNQPAQTPLAWIAVVAYGLTIGSFLNVVIYRLGEQMKGKADGLGLCHPKRSFCPKCKNQLAWSENIPVLSYIIQGGACKSCRAPIPARYPLVEIAGLTAVAVPWAFAPTVTEAIVACIFLTAMIAATGIDLETKKIPDKVSLTALAAALGLAFLPGGIGTEAVIGAAGCFLLMLGFVELGKRLFGKKKISLKEKTEIRWENGTLRIQEPGKSLEESELMEGRDLPFTRQSDRIVLQGEFTVGDEKTPRTVVVLAADTSERVEGHLKSITFPREAMGMGDAKLLALCGAVLGFQGAVQGLAWGAGTAVGMVIAARLVAKMTNSNPPELIAFGPWIAGGCTAVMLWGWL